MRFAAVLVVAVACSAAFASDPGQPRNGAPLPNKQATTAESTKKTPSESWSNFGWTVFRWGMGPGDVAERLRATDGEFQAKEPSCTVSTIRERSIDCEVLGKGHAFRVLGRGPDTSFGFFEGQLWTTRLYFYVGGASEDGEAMFQSLAALLEKKYGKPAYVSIPKASTDKAGHVSTVKWEVPAISVELMGMYFSAASAVGAGSSISLSYADPRRYELYLHAPVPKGSGE